MTTERMFAIQNGDDIPWSVIAPHERQALNNHGGQTLERLHERRGLSMCEAVAVLEDRAWRVMPDDVARARLKELVATEVQLASVLKARAAIVEREERFGRLGDGGVRDGMPCPICGTGALGYSIAPNGHIWARCSTQNCVRWLE